MKRFLLLLSFLMFIKLAFCQSIEDIKGSGLYLWGEGNGSTLKSADAEALAMLINQIEVQVESSVSSGSNEVTLDGKSEYQESFKAAIETYSSATLKNTERIVMTNEPDASIFRYILRSEIDKVFKERESRIKEFAEEGQKSLDIYKIADALRYYYWAFSLLRSHPNGMSLSWIDKTGAERLLSTWLPVQINDIFSKLTFKVLESSVSENLTTYLVSFNYDNNPARSFDYAYWDGSDWSNINSIKNGLGSIELAAKNQSKEIKLKAEYIFEGEASVDRELQNVLQKIEPIPFRGSYFVVSTEIKKPDTIAQVALPIIENTLNKGFAKLGTVENTTVYEKAIAQLKNAIISKDYATVKDLFTEEGFDIYTKLLQYGQARLVGDHELRFIKFGNTVICRSLPMKFCFVNNNKNFIEEVVFHFDENAKISNIVFALDDLALEDITQSENWSDDVKMVLINFLENYKTAFALKRLDYIESIFADDALIIVGRVVQQVSSVENKYVNNKIVQYNRFTKEQFVKKLEMSFNSKEYINLRFSESDVRRSGVNDSLFGIQIKQDYFSSNYGDTGYLFLMVEFASDGKSIIRVRTWQPNKNADGSIYGVSDF